MQCVSLSPYRLRWLPLLAILSYRCPYLAGAWNDIYFTIDKAKLVYTCSFPVNHCSPQLPNVILISRFRVGPTYRRPPISLQKQTKKMNASVAWESMDDVEAQQRVATLRTSAAVALHHVHDHFTPWQYISTGRRTFDALLGVAGVCGGGRGAGPSDIDADGGHFRRGSGGFAVGGVHELYGPPLAGKSFLLRRLAATFVRRMTAFRQWYLEEQLRDASWGTMPSSLMEGDAGETEGSDKDERRRVVPPAPAAGLQGWDLYVCLIRGSASLSESEPSSPCASPSVMSWQELLMNALPSASSPSMQQRQRDYVADHCHVAVVSTPNELLDFVAGLLQSDDDEASSSPHPSCFCSAETCAVVEESVHSADAKRESQTAAAAALTAEERRRQLKRSRSPSADCTADTTASSSASPDSLLSRRTWRLHRQRLLLIDGLDGLWLHPSFGTHSGTHAGQWFAMELLRHLRCFVAPRGTATASPAVLSSSVVVTNGCQGGSYSFQTPQQLQSRLCTAVGPRPSMFASVPRPAGNGVWGIGVDTRCLIEPAHPGLAAAAAAANASVDHVKGQHPVESHVTVMHGGVCVCAAWVERCDGDANEPL